MVRQLSGQVFQPVNGVFIIRLILALHSWRGVELALLNHAEELLCTRSHTSPNRRAWNEGTSCVRGKLNRSSSVSVSRSFCRCASHLARRTPDLDFFDIQGGILFETAQLERGRLGAGGEASRPWRHPPGLQCFACYGLESPIPLRPMGMRSPTRSGRNRSFSKLPMRHVFVHT